MDGQKSTEVVPAALEPAAPSPGGLPMAAPLTGFVGALGNHNMASMEAASEQRPAFTPTPPADNALGRALADTVQNRSAPAVARIPNISMPKLPGATPSTDPAAPSSTPSSTPSGPQPAGPQPAGPQPAPDAGRLGGMSGMGEMIKKMMEEHARKKAALEAEIAELEPSVAAIPSQVIPGLAAGIQGATSHMAPNLLSANVRALAPAIVGLKVAPDAESFKVAIMDQLRTAVATLESMDEPVEKTVEDTKASATTAVGAVDAAIAAGQQTDPAPEGGAAPAAGGGAAPAAKPRASESLIASLTAAKAQLATVDQLTAALDPASVASLATFTNATATSLGALAGGAHETMKEHIEGARRNAIGAARQMEAMGRSKEENYTVVAGALGGALGQATAMHAISFVHLDKQKRALAAMTAPPAEPAPAGP